MTEGQVEYVAQSAIEIARKAGRKKPIFAGSAVPEVSPVVR
jgi:hypothetical protein